MSKVYIAKNAIGKYKTGEEIAGLTDERITYLLKIGAIVEQGGGEDTSNNLDSLTKAELKAMLEAQGVDYDESDTKAELIARFDKD